MKLAPKLLSNGLGMGLGTADVPEEAGALLLTEDEAIVEAEEDRVGVDAVKGVDEPVVEATVLVLLGVPERPRAFSLRQSPSWITVSISNSQ